jgi:D-alanyl-lipoteichoic acid acyltransferase DltB (MBOAT superfamily)
MGLPRVKQILGSEVATPFLITWTSLYLELIWEALSLAAKGHVWVGVLRLFGFNIFRNTYKPLLAETIVEFWNRYYYYFKELMMEFFFLPTYARYFRNQATLRVIAAVFAAAFVGNMYYHLLQAKEPLVAADLDTLGSLLGARFVYCFLLAGGIAISMLRQQSQRGKPKAAVASSTAGLHRLRRIACVWTFFAVINFWNVIASLSVPERARLFLSLFGL